MTEEYYVEIAGEKLDRAMIDCAKRAVEGAGDGRISIDDAKALLALVKDADNYTDIEKKTMKHIRDNFQFTDAGNEFFRTEIRKWAATK